MKKLLSALLLAGLFVVAACDDDQYSHQFVVVNPASAQAFCYADATLDTVRVATTDAYTVKSEAAWMHIAPGSEEAKLKYNYGYAYMADIALTFDANTTGRPRRAYLAIATTGPDSWSQTVNVQYIQYGWLNILQPAAAITYGDASHTLETATADFLATDSALQTTDAIEFIANADWTLTEGAQSFVHPATTSGHAGRHKIDVALDADATLSDTLYSTLTLTSRGVSTPIRFRQIPLKR